ncbi:hypothetical protein PS834_03922 [Pseudomonas fluorescens]|nr:hypothetical protein PS834_03922 [Pseudomonas fluorescens]
MPFVGASLLAKIVNDNAPDLNECGVLEFFASKLLLHKGMGNLGGQKKPRQIGGVEVRAWRSEIVQASLPR